MTFLPAASSAGAEEELFCAVNIGAIGTRDLSALLDSSSSSASSSLLLSLLLFLRGEAEEELGMGETTATLDELLLLLLLGEASLGDLPNCLGRLVLQGL